MGKELNYLFAAETDCSDFEIFLKMGHLSNNIGMLAQQACEKYLKHMLCLAEGIGKDQNYKIPNLSETDNPQCHNLVYLSNRLYKNDDVSLKYSIRQNLSDLTNIYRTVRYPDAPGYHIITKGELDICKITVLGIKESALQMNQEYIKSHKLKASVIQTNIDRNINVDLD